MATKILQSDAKEYVELYHKACKSMGENENEVTKYLDIEKSTLEEIFAKAASDNIVCNKVRIYFGKRTDYDSSKKYPKFCSKDDYNLVIVGVDDKDTNINSTQEIYDHLGSVTGPATSNDF